MDGWAFILKDIYYLSLSGKESIIPFGQIIVDMHYWEYPDLRELIHKYPFQQEKCTPQLLVDAMEWFKKEIGSIFTDWQLDLIINQYMEFMTDFAKAFVRGKSIADSFGWSNWMKKECWDCLGIDPSNTNISSITIGQLYFLAFCHVIRYIDMAKSIISRFFEQDDSLADLYDLDKYKNTLSFSLRILIYDSKFERVMTAGNFISMALMDITNVMEKNVEIKLCQNCGKHFIPANRSDTKYCCRQSPQDAEKTCQEYGKYNAWMKKTKEDESYSLYRKIYMQKQMMAKRNPDIPLYKANFEQFKADSKNWKQQVKEGISTPNAYLEWLKQNTIN